MSIADVYLLLKPKCPNLLWKAIAYYKTNDTILYGATKCGEEYANNKDYNALAYYNESGILFKN
jgi:hypothetical protein